MSVCYWGIVGYGIDVRSELKVFDFDKVMKELNLKKENYSYSEKNFGWLEDDNGFYLEAEDIFDCMLNKPEFEKWLGLLDFCSTGNNDAGEYFYYASNNPWTMSEAEKNISKEDVENAIVDILLRVTILTEEEIRDNIGDVSVGGEG